MPLTKPQGDMVVKLAAEQASTSGTAITFTGIPAGTSRIAVMCEGVSTNGTGNIKVQLGDAGGLETSGYSGESELNDGTSFVAWSADVAAPLNTSVAAAASYHLYADLILKDAANNTWFIVIHGSGDNLQQRFGSGYKSLSAVLDKVAVISTDTFDAGSISIAYF